MDAAERLRDEGRMDDARFMLQQAKRLMAEPPGPALAVPEAPPEPAPPAAPAGLQEIEAERLAAERGLEAARARAPVTEATGLIELAAEEEARAAAEIEAARGAAVVPGVAEPVTYDEQTSFPFMRPTRIVETREGRLYRDPTTGDLRPPTLGEEWAEA
jgi:hypothetical protein